MHKGALKHNVDSNNFWGQSQSIFMTILKLISYYETLTLPLKNMVVNHKLHNISQHRKNVQTTLEYER